MMKWLKRFLIAVLSLFALATLALYLIPLDTYVPQLESVATGKLHVSVKIGHLKAGLLPPHLLLQDIQVGEAAGIHLGTIKVVPDILALFAGQRVLRRIEVDEGSATLAQLQTLAALVQAEPAQANAVRIAEVQLHNMRLLIPQLALDPLQGTLEFGADGKLTRAWFALSEQKASVTLLPQPGGVVAVTVQAQSWPVPSLAGVILERLDAQGVLSSRRLDIRKFSLQARGLNAAGRVSLEWEPKWKVALKLDALRGEIGHLLAPNAGITLGGQVQATGRLEATGTNVAELMRNLKLDAQLQVLGASINIPARLLHPLQVDALTFHLSGTQSRYDFTDLSARLYGGILSGNGSADSATGEVSADLESSKIAIQPLLGAVNAEAALSGTLDANARFSIATHDPAGFPGNMQLNGAFRVNEGELKKVDLAQAASHLANAENKGGSTRFNELSGLLSVDARGYHLRKLKVSSGVMSASGSLDVTPQQQLDGQLDTDMKGTASLISMPLAVSGTLRDPVLRPTRSAVAGATVGTALLGPGVGTALGIKAGNLVHRLFGNDDKKTDEKQDPTPKK